MNVQRFTRLMNAHSKSLKHHAAMQTIFFASYNFCRKHEATKQTPTMAAGLTDKSWSLQQLIERASAGHFFTADPLGRGHDGDIHGPDGKWPVNVLK